MKLLAHITELKQSRLARNASWVFAGQGLSFLTQAVYFICLARLLGTSQYGILAAAVALVAIAGQYSTLGSGLIFLRYVSPDHSRFREYWGNVLLSTVVFGGLLVFGLHVAGRWLVGEASARLVLIVGVGECLFGQLTASAGQVFQSFERLRYTATLNLLTNLLRLVAAVIMLVAFRHATAWQWASVSVTVSFFAVVAAIVTITRKFGWPRFSPKLMFARAGEGLVFAISGSTTVVYNDIDKAMLGHYGMNIANGIYAMAYRVVNIATMPVMSVQAAAFPRFFREGSQGLAGTEPLARKILKRTVLLALVSAAGMFLLAPIIPHIVGHAFAESVLALRWLVLIPVFRCFHVCAGDAMAGAGYQRFRLYSQLVAAGGNFAMNLYMIPHYSWLGAAWASLLTDGSLAAMSWTVFFWLKRRESAFLPTVQSA